MKRALPAALALAVVAVLLTLVLVATTPPGGTGSTLSRGPSGWAAARLYLERRGTAVELHDRPLDDALGRARVLVLVFPWQRWERSPLYALIVRHLQSGGAVLFAYSGSRVEPPGEGRVAEALGLREQALRPEPPLAPWSWRAFASEEWELRRDGVDAPPVRVRAFASGYAMPSSGRPLLLDAKDRPLAFVYPRGRGQVVVLPASVLANAALGEPGAADLLETLRAALPPRWTFDEYHHGLVSAATPAAVGGRRVFDLWLLHVAVVYLLALLALCRPFGPVWADPPVRAGSAASFLRGLGRLHDRLGHHDQAKALLWQRAHELDPRLPERADAAPGEDLLALARRLAGAQHHSRRTEA